MDEVKCELCPIQLACEAYKEAVKDNELECYPQRVVRVWEGDCPLISLVKELQEEKK